jgi:hypothetical protein
MPDRAVSTKRLARAEIPARPVRGSPRPLSRGERRRGHPGEKNRGASASPKRALTSPGRFGVIARPFAAVSGGRIPKWPTGADCKSAGLRLRWFESSSYHHFFRRRRTTRLLSLFGLHRRGAEARSSTRRGNAGNGFRSAARFGSIGRPSASLGQWAREPARFNGSNLGQARSLSPA